MARPVSAKVRAIRKELRERLVSAPPGPGRNFFSNRSLAAHYGISYQTAHRILASLAEEGLLQRRRGAPSLVAGEVERLTKVALVMGSRAYEEGTFGSRLRGLLESALEGEGIAFDRVGPEAVEACAYPVFWNVEPPRAFLEMHRFCLLLNARPALGLSAGWVDTISVDNYAGGMMAGELLRDRFGLRRTAVLGGPKGDPRSRARIAGFRAVFPKAACLEAGSWGYRLPKGIAAELSGFKPEGVFCVNDRLAIRLKGIYGAGGLPFRLVGFDNAPAAAEEGLSTVGIPWQGLVRAALAVIRGRLRGRRETARDQILRLEPVLRLS